MIECSEQNLNCKEIIEGLAKVLKKHTGECSSLPKPPQMDSV